MCELIICELIIAINILYCGYIFYLNDSWIQMYKRRKKK